MANRNSEYFLFVKCYHWLQIILTLARERLNLQKFNKIFWTLTGTGVGMRTLMGTKIGRCRVRLRGGDTQIFYTRAKSGNPDSNINIYFNYICSQIPPIIKINRSNETKYFLGNQNSRGKKMYTPSPESKTAVSVENTILEISILVATIRGDQYIRPIVYCGGPGHEIKYG